MNTNKGNIVLFILTIPLLLAMLLINIFYSLRFSIDSEKTKQLAKQPDQPGQTDSQLSTSTQNQKIKITSGGNKYIVWLDTDWGRITLNFNTKYQVRNISEKVITNVPFDGLRFAIDGNPIRIYYVDYWPSYDDLINKLAYIKDGDAHNPGSGCYFETPATPLLVHNYNAKRLLCYYNPMGTTVSGKYNPKFSIFLYSDCIIGLDRIANPNVHGGFHIWGTAEIGHDTCQFIDKELSNLTLVY